jgi:hypothetical protein
MSLNLTRRDAIKGAMAATAALAAAPYLGNLVGGVQASPLKTGPTKTEGASGLAANRQEASAGTEEATVLYIKGDVVKSYKGMQSIKVQDSALASKLRSALNARFD